MTADLAEIAVIVAAFATLTPQERALVLAALRDGRAHRRQVIAQCVDLLADLHDPFDALGQIAHELHVLGFSPDQARAKGARAA